MNQSWWTVREKSTRIFQDTGFASIAMIFTHTHTELCLGKSCKGRARLAGSPALETWNYSEVNGYWYPSRTVTEINQHWPNKIWRNWTSIQHLKLCVCVSDCEMRWPSFLAPSSSTARFIWRKTLLKGSKRYSIERYSKISVANSCTWLWTDWGQLNNSATQLAQSHPVICRKSYQRRPPQEDPKSLTWQNVYAFTVYCVALPCVCLGLAQKCPW